MGVRLIRYITPSQTTPTHDIMDLSMISWMYDVMDSLNIKTHYFNAMIVNTHHTHDVTRVTSMALHHGLKHHGHDISIT